MVTIQKESGRTDLSDSFMAIRNYFTALVRRIDNY